MKNLEKVYSSCFTCLCYVSFIQFMSLWLSFVIHQVVKTYSFLFYMRMHLVTFVLFMVGFFNKLPNKINVFGIVSYLRSAPCYILVAFQYISSFRSCCHWLKSFTGKFRLCSSTLDFPAVWYYIQAASCTSLQVEQIQVLLAAQGDLDGSVSQVQLQISGAAASFSLLQIILLFPPLLTCSFSLSICLYLSVSRICLSVAHRLQTNQGLRRWREGE